MKKIVFVFITSFFLVESAQAFDPLDWSKMKITDLLEHLSKSTGGIHLHHGDKYPHPSALCKDESLLADRYLSECQKNPEANPCCKQMKEAIDPNFKSAMTALIGYANKSNRKRIPPSRQFLDKLEDKIVKKAEARVEELESMAICAENPKSCKNEQTQKNIEYFTAHANLIGGNFQKTALLTSFGNAAPGNTEIIYRNAFSENGFLTKNSGKSPSLCDLPFSPSLCEPTAKLPDPFYHGFLRAVNKYSAFAPNSSVSQKTRDEASRQIVLDLQAERCRLANEKGKADCSNPEFWKEYLDNRMGGKDRPGNIHYEFDFSSSVKEISKFYLSKYMSYVNENPLLPFIQFQENKPVEGKEIANALRKVKKMTEATIGDWKVKKFVGPYRMWPFMADALRDQETLDDLIKEEAEANGKTLACQVSRDIFYQLKTFNSNLGNGVFGLCAVGGLAAGTAASPAAGLEFMQKCGTFAYYKWIAETPFKELKNHIAIGEDIERAFSSKLIEASKSATENKTAATNLAEVFDKMKQQNISSAISFAYLSATLAGATPYVVVKPLVSNFVKQFSAFGNESIDVFVQYYATQMIMRQYYRLEGAALKRAGAVPTVSGTGQAEVSYGESIELQRKLELQVRQNLAEVCNSDAKRQDIVDSKSNDKNSSTELVSPEELKLVCDKLKK